jgi:hypothetical protein
MILKAFDVQIRPPRLISYPLNTVSIHQLSNQRLHINVIRRQYLQLQTERIISHMTVIA